MATELFEQIEQIRGSALTINEFVEVISEAQKILFLKKNYLLEALSQKQRESDYLKKKLRSTDRLRLLQSTHPKSGAANAVLIDIYSAERLSILNPESHTRANEECETFVDIKLGNQRQRTQAVESFDPVWNTAFEL